MAENASSNVDLGFLDELNEFRRSPSGQEERENAIHALEENKVVLGEAFQRDGVCGVVSYINEMLDSWKNLAVNIAVIGRSGVGKSTFINAIRGVKYGDPLYAAVGPCETTTSIRAYEHPSNSNLKFWDLPGCGTTDFPRASYMTDKRIKFEHYDIYLILSSERFDEYDGTLAENIKTLKKPFLYIRTKVDIDIDNDKKEKGEKANEKNVVQELRVELKFRLKNQIESVDDFYYLIGSYDIQNPLLDFERLHLKLLSSIDESKKQIVLYAINHLTPNIIKEKVKHFRTRIWKMGVLSAVGGAIPIPGVGLAIDTGLIAKEFEFYRSQLGISDAQPRSLAKVLDTSVKELTEKYNSDSFLKRISARGLAGLLGMVGSEMLEESSKVVFPVIGSIIGAGTSYTTTTAILQMGLSMMEKDALFVLKKLKEKHR